MTNLPHDRDDESPSLSSEDLTVDPMLPRPTLRDRKRKRLVGWLVGGSLLVGMIGLGTLWHFLSHPEVAARPSTPEPTANRKELARNIFFEVQGQTRRVIVKSTVCLREGHLEGLLCRNRLKAHEYILSADLDAIKLHAALIAAGAQPGSPVKFEPKYSPASGSIIKITLQYEKDGKQVRMPGQQWIRSGKNGDKVPDLDWVFAGSMFIEPEEKEQPRIYLANQGDLICVCNMEDAMLDLPIRSPTNPDDRIFTAYSERIPPLETPVDVIFEPVLAKK